MICNANQHAAHLAELIPQAELIILEGVVAHYIFPAESSALSWKVLRKARRLFFAFIAGP